MYSLAFNHLTLFCIALVRQDFRPKDFYEPVPDFLDPSLLTRVSIVLINFTINRGFTINTTVNHMVCGLAIPISTY